MPKASHTRLPGSFALDVLGLSPAGAYSLRRLRSGYAGSAIQVTRDSDSTTLDIGFIGENLDVAALQTFCSGTNGNVTIWYDQSGNARDQTAVAASVARICTSGVVLRTSNGAPKIVSTGSTSGFTSGTFTAYTGTTASVLTVGALANGANFERVVSLTSAALADSTGGTTVAAILMRDGSNSTMASYRNNVATASIAYTVNVFYSMGARYDGTNYNIYRNGATNSSASSAAFNVNRMLIGAGSNTVKSWAANSARQEAIFWLSDIGNTALVAASDNQRVFFGCS